MKSPLNINSFRQSLLQWFGQHGRDLPWRKTCDPYAILVSELMLQQTQVATVIPYYNRWFRRFPDFVSLAGASENDVLHAWQGLGYYNRARNLFSIAKIVQERYRGSLPGEVAEIRALPGVGRYTANAIASFAWNQPVPIVEANSSRVLTRLFDIRIAIESAIGREKLWKYATHLVPRLDAARFNSAFLDLGALVCLPKKPKCKVCPVKKFCRTKRPETLPIRKSKPRTKRLIERHAFMFRNGRVLLEESWVRWRGMWILPALERDCLKQSSLDGAIYKSTFPFTRHRVTLIVHRRPVPKRIAPNQRWFKSIDHIAMPSPHRRAAQALFNATKAAQPPQRQLSKK